jgi:hypothetical protein
VSALGIGIGTLPLSIYEVKMFHIQMAPSILPNYGVRDIPDIPDLLPDLLSTFNAN